VSRREYTLIELIVFFLFQFLRVLLVLLVFLCLELAVFVERILRIVISTGFAVIFGDNLPLTQRAPKEG
jgi:hypothetical protein